MQAIGRRGGSTPKMTALRRAVAEHDDQLRELARETLAKSLRGEEVGSAQLQAAKALFSYRAGEAPRQMPAAERSPGKPIGLADLLEAAAESKMLSQLGLDADVERSWLEKLRTRDASDVVANEVPAPYSPHQEVDSAPVAGCPPAPATLEDFVA